MEMLQEIKKKWQQYNPNKWWGDSVDVRFHLVSELKTLKNQCVLDIGCSIGLILSELDKSNQKYGFDINRQFIQRARELNPDAQLLCHSMFEAFPYQDNTFDSIIMAHACPRYNIPDKNNQKHQVLGEIYRLLKPGGTLYLTTSNKNYILQRHHYPPRKLFYQEIKQDLHMFKNVTIYGWNPIPSFVFFLPQRVFAKIPKKYWKFLFVPSSILAKIPYIISIFRWLMKKPWLLRYSKALYVVAVK